MTPQKSSKKSRVTLEHVAEDAGVSRATVSLVIRSSPLVSDETREKVFASIQKLGYVRHQGAASLRSQRSKTIGLIITDLSNPFFAQMTLGCEEVFETADYAMIFGTSSERRDKQDQLIRMMRGYAVDGILLCPANGTTNEITDQFSRWKIPLVLVARYLSDVQADYVGADNQLGAEQAVEHLINLGHRKIAFIGGPKWSSARVDRYQGYTNVLTKYGIQIEPEFSVCTSVSRDDGHQAIIELLSQENKPTAALCYNDIVAIGVMLGLQAIGKKPGVDFDVIGFDDIDEAALWQPSLSTVSIPPRQVGIDAAKLLLERIENYSGKPYQKTIPPQLILRQSCLSEPDPHLVG